MGRQLIKIQKWFTQKISPGHVKKSRPMAQEVAVDFPQYLTSKVATLRGMYFRTASKTRCSTLTLLDKQIGILGIKRLATALTTTDHAVECLNLAGNEIDDEGADILVKALKKCPSITALDLSSM